MNKSTLTSLARAVKNIDDSLWSIRRGSPEYDLLSVSRQSLVKIIFMNGFELQENTYRLIKSKENRGNKTVIVGNKIVEYWYNDDFQGEISDDGEDPDFEHIEKLIEDGCIEGELLTVNIEETHDGWWRLL